MAKTKKRVAASKNLTIEQWLQLMEENPPNTSFIHYCFPTNHIKDHFLKNIFLYSDETISTVLKRFLSLSEGHFFYDRVALEQFMPILDNEPERAQFIIEVFPYYQKLLDHFQSGGKIPIRDDIAWITWLLPGNGWGAIDALQGYKTVHQFHLPEGRLTGVDDALAILQSRYLNTDEAQARSALDNIGPIDFEHLVEALYREMGYITQMTKQSHDGGVDIIATKNELGKKEVNFIQCKHSQRVVGDPRVRDLLGTVAGANRMATKGTLITTSYFSTHAYKKAQDEPRIELIASKQLQQLLNMHFGQFWIKHLDYLVTESKERHPPEQRI